MNILITGGTGLIGKQLCHALLAQQHQLTVLSRQSAQAVNAACGKVTAIASLEHITADMQFDAVINLAGEPIVDKAWTDKRKQALLDSRVALTQRLVAKLQHMTSPPKVLLSGSAIGYYGDTGGNTVTESDKPGSDFGAHLCQAWENAAKQATDWGARVCILRTGLVLAQSGGLLGNMLLPFKLGMGTTLGAGTQWMSWIHIDDYVAMTLALLDSDRASGVYNMTAPNPVTNHDFTKALAKAVNRFALLRCPAWVLNVALGERAFLLLGGQRVLPERFNQLSHPFSYVHIDQALKSLV